MEKNMKINGKQVSFTDEANLLEVIRKAGIELPTFCYNSELSVYGACRMCLVEDDNGRIMAACSTPPRPGMSIRTHTERLIRQRRVTLELLLANHDRECTTCVKSGNCRLQELANILGIGEIRFGQKNGRLPIDDSSPAIVRDPNKCILCGDCVRMCEEVQGVGVLGFAYRGSNAKVVPPFNKNISEVNCVDCGQCAAVCPTGALTIASHMEKVWSALYDPQKTVVAQIAPAVRVSLGEEFGLKPGTPATGKVVGALKKIGFDKVFDTCFAADVTAIEESCEFLERISKNQRLPQFTSCCPAWVKYVELHYPQYKDNISTCRSPQQMFGSLMKGIYAKAMGTDSENIFVVSIMPCTAKKSEAKREEFFKNGVPDVDAVLTTQELARMIREAGVVFDEVKEMPFDMPLGFATGGGVIFGGSKGVATAVMRVIGKEPDFKTDKDNPNIKTAEIDYNARKIKVATVSGLGNAKKLLEDLRVGNRYYDLIEVMACFGGCIGGGGQPQTNSNDIRKSRKQGLFGHEKLMQLKSSLENPVIKDLYKDNLGEPGSAKAHAMLHTTYTNRKRINESICFFEGQLNTAKKRVVKVCVGTCCYLSGAYDLFSTLKDKLSQEGFKDKVELAATFCFENCTQSPCVMVDDVLIGEATVEKVINEILKQTAVQ